MAQSYYQKIPIIPPVQVFRGDMPPGSTSQMQYEEVYQDHNTMTIRTRGQDEQIKRLEAELQEKKKDKRKKLESIIGYFYKKT